MGKSEVVPMPIHRQDSLFAACKGAFKIPIHTVEEHEEEQLDTLEDMEPFTNQVAGHTDNGRSFGLIKRDGTVLKPVTNSKCGEREIQFYEEVKGSTSKDVVELREFIPNYYGTVAVPIRGQNVDCIVLEDLTKGYKEPCVMDIKIGRRTWDPTAGYQKILKEETKYQDSKRELGFCIPGFQVYKIHNNQFCKFDKEYGKNLNKDTIREALRTFLNAETIFSRSLLVQFLASLWRIQLWFRKQRHFHFYSSSLLLVYDARRLRESFKTDVVKPKVKLNRSTSLYRPLSLAVLNNNNENEKISIGFSGQLTNQGPILKTPRSVKIKEFLLGENNNKTNNNNVWQKSIRSLKRTHSFQNNYDKDMQNKKQDYTDILDELCTEQKSELWASVKMIDFAHAFPAERYEIDKNYLEGIDNLVKIFEAFLADSE